MNLSILTSSPLKNVLASSGASLVLNLDSQLVVIFLVNFCRKWFYFFLAKKAWAFMEASKVPQFSYILTFYFHFFSEFFSGVQTEF